MKKIIGKALWYLIEVFDIETKYAPIILGWVLGVKGEKIT